MAWQHKRFRHQDPSPASHSCSPTSLQPDHHIVLCRLVAQALCEDKSMVWPDRGFVTKIEVPSPIVAFSQTLNLTAWPYGTVLTGGKHNDLSPFPVFIGMHFCSHLAALNTTCHLWTYVPLVNTTCHLWTYVLLVNTTCHLSTYVLLLREGYTSFGERFMYSVLKCGHRENVRLPERDWYILESMWCVEVNVSRNILTAL